MKIQKAQKIIKQCKDENKIMTKCLDGLHDKLLVLSMTKDMTDLEKEVFAMVHIYYHYKSSPIKKRLLAHGITE